AEVDPGKEPVLGLLTLTRALLVAGDQPRAERLLRAALRARPREVVLYQTLGQLLEAGPAPRWARAVECYVAVRALRPGLGQSLAHALVKSGRVRDGLALYEQLVAKSPDNPWLHFKRANDLAEFQRYKEAEAAFRESLRLKPGTPIAHNNLGI